MNYPNRFGFFLLAAVLTVASGCSSTEDPAVTVSGKVTFDGKPLPSGTINFVPADGQGASAGAQITEGTYEANVTPGSKTVMIVAQREIPGKASADPHAGPPMEQYLPAAYNSRTKLTADIPAAGSDAINFELTSDGT